jgi:uroporphyrinogen-III synthase
MKVRDIILTNSGDTKSFNSLINSGFILHHFPMIEISHQEIRPFSLDKYDFYIFTSKNGVDSFFNAPFIKVQYEKKISTICLGEKTAKKN